MKTILAALLIQSVFFTGWAYAESDSSMFDIEVSTQTESQGASQSEAMKKAYYKKYLADYRYRTARHRTFYKNGF